MDIKEYIIKKSEELNIDMIGFTDSSPMGNLEEYLKYRKDNSLITEFEERDTGRRIDPKLTMEGCKSIIVIALSYNVDYKEKSKVKYKGSLSKSSWGMDYHRVLKTKMNELVKEIEEVQQFNHMCFVDTGPLVDRELAHRAGMGYYGKNCSIINDKYGSFIFIGYILTDLEIKVSNKPIESKCGSCDLCIRACPTNALENPFRLNPKRCISYLTQTKDEIDQNLQSKMGIKIYGCDTCQMVCPKNKDVKKSEHEEFIPIKTNGEVDLKELLCMTNRQFRNKYGDMSGSWRGKKILQRNAHIAINNMGIRNVDDV